MVVTILYDVPTAGRAVIRPLVFSIPAALFIPIELFIEIPERRNIIPCIQVPILVFTPRSQRSAWAVGLVFRSLRRRDTLLGLFINEILPPLAVVSEFIPQLRKKQDIANTVGDDLVGNWAPIEDFVRATMFSFEQFLPLLFHQLPVCSIHII